MISKHFSLIQGFSLQAEEVDGTGLGLNGTVYSWSGSFVPVPQSAEDDVCVRNETCAEWVYGVEEGETNLITEVKNTFILRNLGPYAVVLYLGVDEK